MRVLFDEKKALVLFNMLQPKWKAQQGIYREELLPENLYPIPSGRIALANYYLYGALPMRGAVNSDQPFQLIHGLWQDYPDLFKPVRVMKDWNPGRIEHAFKQVQKRLRAKPDLQHRLFEDDVPGDSAAGGMIGAGPMSYNVDNHAAYWYRNSVHLATHWDGNPLKIYEGVTDFEEAFQRIDSRQKSDSSHPGLFGMRRKIFALYTIWLQEKGLVKKNLPTPIPVDFHALRVLWATEVISFEGLAPFVPSTARHPASLAGKQVVQVTEDIVNQIMWWSVDFMQRHRFNHMAINPAIWILSREVCVNHPQNRMFEDGTQFVETDDLVTPMGWRKDWLSVCNGCELKEGCTGAVPGGVYYNTGLLVRIEKAAFPQKAAS